MIFNSMESSHEASLGLSCNPSTWNLLGLGYYVKQNSLNNIQISGGIKTENCRIKQCGSAVVGPNNPTKLDTIVSRGHSPLQITGHILATNKGYEVRKVFSQKGLFRDGKTVVEARGFEPPTPASRTQCATELRYASILYFKLIVIMYC